MGAPSKGTLDPEILGWCEINDFALVTNNRASMPVHLRDHLLAEHFMPAIFILHDSMSMGDTVEELTLIWEVATSEEYANLINFLPVTGQR